MLGGWMETQASAMRGTVACYVFSIVDSVWVFWEYGEWMERPWSLPCSWSSAEEEPETASVQD